MTRDGLALRPVLEQFFSAFPFHEIGVTEAELRSGLDEIYAHLARVGLDAFHARQTGRSFHAAVTDGENYPHLRRLHLAATDILQMSLPKEIVPWLERLLEGPVPPVALEIQNVIARLAVNPATPAHERALIEFLLFQGLRLNLVVAAWRNDREFSGAGARMSDVDRIADEELQWLLELAAKDGPLDRPIHVLVALGMKRLTRHVQKLWTELRLVADEIAKAQKERAVFEARVEAYLRDMNATDAVLVRNRMAPELGEQRLPLEVLQLEHPLALGGMSRAAMDQRAKRLVDHLAQTRGLPERRSPALIDMLEEKLLEEESA